MITYDFVEIGTAIFGTLIENASDSDVGISVEPIKEYLEQIPSKKKVTKVHAAITNKKEAETIKLYYIPLQTLSEHKIAGWMAGCNSVNKPHDFHLAYPFDHEPGYWLDHPQLPIQGRNLVAEGLVKCIDAPLMTFVELGQKYDIGHVGFLKIDTEGHDPYILMSVIEYYQQIGNQYLPKKIQFEKNRHSDKELAKFITEELQKLGYQTSDSHNDCRAVKA